MNSMLVASLMMIVILAPIAVLVALVIWVAKIVSRGRRESAESIAAGNALVIEHLRGISARLDHIDKQLADVPE